MEEKIMEKIKRDVDEIKTEDFALQQVHIARKLLSEEAIEQGINFWEYIKMQAKKIKIKDMQVYNK